MSSSEKNEEYAAKPVPGIGSVQMYLKSARENSRAETSSDGEGLLIACQGTKGAYSNLAAAYMFPKAQFLYFKNFDAVARAVRSNMCRYGVLPIENNTYGSVKAVYTVLREHRVYITRGLKFRIHHELLAKPGTSLRDVTSVCSHEQALGQCSKFLHSLGDKVKIVPAMNTAVAARTVAESSDPYMAAISSPECADIYGLNVLKKKIADSTQNYTRFICVSKEPEVLPDANRISLMLTLPHRPGTLSEVLKKFADADINMMKIESAPIHDRNFEFLFYIDVGAQVRDPEVVRILEELEEYCPEFVLLGNYTEKITEDSF